MKNFGQNRLLFKTMPSMPNPKKPYLVHENPISGHNELNFFAPKNASKWVLELFRGNRLIPEMMPLMLKNLI